LVIGSIAGGIARYVLAGTVYRFFGTSFPHGTLVVNMIGCFLIGILGAFADKALIGPDGHMLLMIGFCGAFTTFSTFILETSNLAGDGEMIKALANVLISVLLGFVLFRAGFFLARAI
jgi:CrcB protein